MIKGWKEADRQKVDFGKAQKVTSTILKCFYFLQSQN